MPPLSPLRSHNYYSPLSPLTPTAEVDIARYRGKPTPITLVTPRASSATAENIRGEPHLDIAKHPLWHAPPCHSGEKGVASPATAEMPPIRQSRTWLIHGTSRKVFAENNGLLRPLPRRCYPSASPGAQHLMRLTFNATSPTAMTPRVENVEWHFTNRRRG